MSARIKGQECAIHMISTTGGTVQLDNVKSFDVETEMKTLEEGYIGQTAQQYDDVLQGFGGTLMIHMSTGTAFDFEQQLIARAQRRVPLFTVNIKAAFNFPDGTRRVLVFKDCFFAAIPTKSPDRSAFVDKQFSWKSGSVTALA